jgi:hypothetical protein
MRSNNNNKQKKRMKNRNIQHAYFQNQRRKWYRKPPFHFAAASTLTVTDGPACTHTALKERTRLSAQTMSATDNCTCAVQTCHGLWTGFHRHACMIYASQIKQTRTRHAKVWYRPLHACIARPWFQSGSLQPPHPREREAMDLYIPSKRLHHSNLMQFVMTEPSAALPIISQA